MRISFAQLGTPLIVVLFACVWGCGGGNDASGTASTTPTQTYEPTGSSATDGYGEYAGTPSNDGDGDAGSSGDGGEDDSGDVPDHDNYGVTTATQGDDEADIQERTYGNPNEGIGPPGAAELAYRNGEAPPNSNDGYGAYAGNTDGIDFAAEIEPILRAQCYNCHGGGPRGRRGDLELHTPDAISAAGIVVAGRPSDSELFMRISKPRGDEGAMPPRGPGLQPDEMELIRKWIEGGANFGDDSSGYASTGNGYEAYGSSAEGVGRDDEQTQRPLPEDLPGLAQYYFDRGNDRDALNHLYAQSLVDSEAGRAILKQYRWVPGLKRPKLAVRWGIGVNYHQEGAWDAAPRPIGMDQEIPDVRGGDADDRDDAPEYQNPYIPEHQNAALEYFTGDFGSTMIRRLEMRIQEGFYGEVLKTQFVQAGKSGDDDEDDSVGEYGGGAGISRPPSRGGDGYGGFGGGGGSSNGGDSDEPADKVESIMPGVTMLGHASRTELLKRASEEGVDLVAIFEVNEERNHKARLYVNTTKVRLYDVETQQQVAVSKGLNNIAVQRAREKDPEDDSVNLALDKLFLDVADKQYRSVDFPAGAEPKHAKKFVKELLDKPHQQGDQPLWMLSEVRFYQRQNLLTASEVEYAFRQLAPENGPKLVQPSDDEAKTMLASWLAAPARLVPKAEDDDTSDESSPESQSEREAPAFR